MKRTTFAEAFGGDYLAAADFAGKPVTLKIAGVEGRELIKPDMSKEVKFCLTFAGTKKALVLNVTNAICLKRMWGEADPETGQIYIDQWIGHRVTFYPAEDTSGMSEDGLCIRIKGSPELEKTISFTTKIGLGNKSFKLVATTKDAAEGEVFEEKEAEDDIDAALAGPAPNPLDEMTTRAGLSGGSTDGKLL